MFDMQPFYDAILKTISDAIITLDKEGKIILINESGEMILGISSKEVFGKNYSQYFDIDAISSNMEVHKNVIDKILKTDFGTSFLSSEVNIIQKIAEPNLRFSGVIYVVRYLK
jgi:PAS domain S-box-containing protein